jgi:DNA-binding transcriptional LysR family regulator
MDLRGMDLISLSLFTLVAQSGCLERAAHLAGLSADAASGRLADLEAVFGMALFVRNAETMALTPAGAALQRHLQRSWPQLSSPPM